MNKILLGLGSNLGDRRDNLRAAVEMLGREMAVVRVSSFYESPAWGYESDEEYLNIVLLATTQLNAKELLDFVLATEKHLGRVRRLEDPRYVNRSIDIDILDYNEERINQKELEVPHPRMHERAFVMLPLLEVLPHYDERDKLNVVKKWLERDLKRTDCVKKEPF